MHRIILHNNTGKRIKKTSQPTKRTYKEVVTDTLISYVNTVLYNM